MQTRQLKAYYLIKPFIPYSLRMWARHKRAIRKRTQVGNIWPIMPGSERPPKGWPGWPEGKQFAVVLTHDVESTIGLKRINQLMELEMGLGFRSCFNLIPEGDYIATADVRNQITGVGFEVGVHDLYHDGKLYKSRSHFHACAQRINRYLKEWNAVGFRAGFMHHNLDWLHELNILYDCSTFDTDPFEPQPIGENTIFPFWVTPPAARNTKLAANDSMSCIHTLTSDLRLQTSISSCATIPGYVELPYTLPQDSTLFLVLAEQQPDIWLKKLDWIANQGGMVLVNVHPDYLYFTKASTSYSFPAEHYARLLRHIRQRYGNSFWQPLPKDIAEWYHKKVLPSLSQNNRGGTSAISLKQPSSKPGTLKGKRAAVVLYSTYPWDARPRRELESLLAEGMHIDLLCLQDNPEEPEQETSGSLFITRLPVQHERSGKIRYLWQYSYFWFRSFLWLSLRSISHCYDLVHVHNMPDFLVFTALFPRLLGARIILDLHDPMPELYQTIFKLDENSFMVSLLKRLEKWSIGFAHQVLTPNVAFRDLFCSRSCLSSRISIVMNTPDERIFQRLKPAPTLKTTTPRKDLFRLMYHGLIAERHGLEIAVAAINILKHTMPGLVLYMYGERNSYSEQMLYNAKELGLTDKVHYLGKVKLDNIPNKIIDADLGIIPNLRTPFTEINFPVRIFEYLCMDKPVIVPDTRGIRDYFDDTQIIFFQPNNPEDLARKIFWVYEHPEETKSILYRGRRVYEQHRWEFENLHFVEVISSIFQDKLPINEKSLLFQSE